MKYSIKDTTPLPPLDVLNDLFSYDSETGVLTWKERPVGHFKNNGSFKSWNTKNSGLEAGSVSQGYKKVRLNGKTFQYHRLCYLISNGCEPEHIDHINGDRLDNRASNLRSVTCKENSRNRPRNSNNKSGSVGVHRVKGKWRAMIGNKHIGYFTDKIDAIYARYWAERDAGYHENHGR